MSEPEAAEKRSAQPEGLPLGVPVPGRVARLVQARRYAFIRLAEGRQVFMPQSALRGLRFTELQPDQDVDCWLEIGCAGLQAVRVQRRRSPRRKDSCVNRSAPPE